MKHLFYYAAAIIVTWVACDYSQYLHNDIVIEAKQVIADCEKTLPREQHCVLAAKHVHPAKIGNDHGTFHRPGTGGGVLNPIPPGNSGPAWDPMPLGNGGPGWTPVR
ncbi:hypothetical protein SG34_010415 [Thalassomonas viridans]|uniref:Lipoprotein n=1 Tax=Thalassomonas viridans TaxID=137584 RepID=A0AAF0CCC3_9GAMM|nr:hypothetical protein [Thalassomonas viridans]WDE07259.1 hypothetical protein SG34_010415 [Thalassomonas viridans]